MRIFNNYLKLPIGLLLSISITSTVMADGEPNGNYTYAGVSIFSTTFAKPLCIGTECHPGLGGAAIDMQFQAIPNIAISISGAAAQSTGSQYTIKSSAGGVSVAFIAGLGTYVDVAAILGSVSSQAKICTTASNVCTSATDSGSQFGLAGKVWLNENKNINIGLSFSSAKYSKSTNNTSTAAFSLALIPSENHEFDIVSSSTSDNYGYALSSDFSVGYRYLFDHGRPSSRSPRANATESAPIEPNKAANSVSNDAAQKLRELNTLKNEGVITDSEYQLKKKQLLEKY